MNKDDIRLLTCNILNILIFLVKIIVQFHPWLPDAYDANIECIIVKGVASYFHQRKSAASEWMSFASAIAASMVAKMLNDPKLFLECPHYDQVTDLTAEKNWLKRKIQKNRDFKPLAHWLMVTGIEI